MQFSFADGIKVTLLTYVGRGGAIKLDCNKNRVYWLEYVGSIGRIRSCDYAGGEKKTITGGSINSNLLGVLGDSLYFLDKSEYHINEMNVSNGSISRTIPVERENYQDLLVVDKSVQPRCKYSRIMVCVSFNCFFGKDKHYTIITESNLYFL